MRSSQTLDAPESPGYPPVGATRGAPSRPGARRSRGRFVLLAMLVLVGLVAAVPSRPSAHHSGPLAGAAASNASREAAPARAAAPTVPVLTPPPSLDPHVPLDGSHPLRVLVIGDSVANTLQGSFSTAVDTLTSRGVPAEITRYWTVPGFGLTSDHYGLMDWDGANLDEVQVPDPEWYESWQEDVLRWTAEDRPDIVLVLAGAWDSIPRHADDRWLVPGSADWRRWYMQLVDDANAELGSTGALVVWLRYPCIESEKQSARIEMVNGVVEQAASLRPGRVTVLPFDEKVCPGGGYTPTWRPAGEDGDAPLRLSDGVHFHIFGSPNFVGPWLADQIEPLVGPKS